MNTDSGDTVREVLQIGDSDISESVWVADDDGERPLTSAWISVDIENIRIELLPAERLKRRDGTVPLCRMF